MFPTTHLLLVSSVFFSVVSSSEDYSLATCLRKDSISCVQVHLYKKLRALLSQQTIELLGGFRIVKEKSDDLGKSILEDNNNTVDGRIYKELEVSDRQLLLEDLVFNKLFNFFKHRKIQWNLVKAVEEMLPAARKLFSKVPEHMKNKLVHYAAEGRGKKKFMRMFVPVIIAFKMTVFTWVKVIYVGVALLAKKAIVIAMMALMIAIYAAVKKQSYKEYRPPHYEIHGETIHSVPYYPVSWPSGGHAVHAVHSGHDAYDMHASQSVPAHYMAYSAQKPNYN